MATGYQAVVRVRTEAVAPAREEAVVALLRQRLPATAVVHHDRESTGELRLTITLPLEAEDASQVEIRAREVTQESLQHAGLTEEAATVDDVSVKAGG